MIKRIKNFETINGGGSGGFTLTPTRRCGLRKWGGFTLTPMRRCDPRKQGGFTLIEMLIVIAVIAILAGVVLTGVGGFQATARDTRRIGDLRNTQNYLELFFNKCGHYPVDNGTTCGGTSPTDSGTVTWNELTTALKTVTSQVPKDPGNTPYEYGYSNGGLMYVLEATFERDNNALKEDVDGTVFGVDCDDGSFHYCTAS